METVGGRVLSVGVAIACGLALPGWAQSLAQPEIRLGAAAYNGNDYKSAIEHFRKAVSLDVNNVNAKLFLATAYTREFGVEPPPARYGALENSPLLAGALRQYEDVLARNPKNVPAMFGLAAVAGPDRWKEAHDWMLKAIAIDARNKDAYYTAGVLDWRLAFQQLQRARSAAGIPPQAYEIPDPNLRRTLRNQALPQIQEGFRMLQAALQLDPNWPEALAYMNLMYRTNASLVDSPAEARDLIAKADASIVKALTLMRARRGQGPGPGLARMDPEGLPPPAPLLAPPPPPPPPPPPQQR